MKKIILPLLLLLFAAGTAHSQAYIGLYGVGSHALNDFQKNKYRDGYGFSMEILSNNLTQSVLRSDIIDFRLGVGFDFLGAGREKYSIVLNTPNSDPGSLLVKNGHVGFLGIARFTFAGESRVSPYVDLFGGTRLFNSYELIRTDEVVEGYEQETRKSVYSRGALHYGLSLGAIYNINSVVGVDARVSYSKGANAPWIDLNSTEKSGNSVTYQSKNTTTDLLIFKVGFIFRITPGSGSHDNDSNGNDNYTPERTNPSPSPSPSPAPKPQKPLDVKPSPAPAPAPAPRH